MSKQPKLTDTQLIVLSKAAEREDGCATAPEKLNRSAAQKVGASLIARKLMREMRAKPNQPVWSRDAQGQGVALVITKQGRKAIGVEAAREPVAAAPALPAEQPSDEKPATGDAAGSATGVPSTPFRKGSKAAQLVTMLSAPGGTTLDAIVDATGWLPHTARAALTGLRKRGFAIERSRQDGQGSSIYRIGATAVARSPSKSGGAQQAQASA